MGGWGGKGGEEDRINGMGVGDNLQVIFAVFLYGINSLVVMGAMLKLLEGFHHWEAIYIVEMTVQRMTGGEWGWPAVSDALETTGICPIKEYIHQRQDTIAVQVDVRTIYELCTG